MKSKLSKEKDTAPLAVAVEETSSEKMKKNKGRVRDVVRVSVDFPRNLYNRVVEETDQKEQTIRDFILTLVRQHFGD